MVRNGRTRSGDGRNLRMDESTDAMAERMAAEVNPNPAPKRTCDCCGVTYDRPDAARFSSLRTNGKSYLVCGDCIQFLWKHKNWINQPELPWRKRLWRRK